MDETILALFSERDLCVAMGARLVHPQNRTFLAICTDSRKVSADDLFIALVGERFDAHDFVPDVIAKGCRGILVSRELEVPDNVAMFVVDDVLKAFGKLAQSILEKRRQLGSFTTYAITGSNGKTTTKELLSLLLETQGHRVLKTEGNFNNFVGLPMTVLGLRKSHDVAVLEMGANAPGEIAYLSGLGKPDIAIITCVGSAHLLGFGSIEGVAKAKGEMIHAPNLKAIVLPEETKRFYENEIPAGVTPIWVGGENSSTKIHLENITSCLDGIRFELRDGESVYHVELPLLGRHNAGNLARAYAASTVNGTLDESAIHRAVARVHLPSGRLERWTANGEISFLHDAYNANPSSMSEAIHLMAQWDVPRALILGDMRELGEKSDELHREIGRKAAGIDPILLLCVGDSSSQLCQGAIEAGMDRDRIHCVSQDQLETGLNWAKSRLTTHCVCLIKGSRGVKLERVLDYFKAERQ